MIKKTQGKKTLFSDSLNYILFFLYYNSLLTEKKYRFLSYGKYIFVLSFQPLKWCSNENKIMTILYILCVYSSLHFISNFSNNQKFS